MANDLTTEVKIPPQPEIKAAIFNARNFSLGLTSMHEFRINEIPVTTQFGVDRIRAEALLLAKSVRATCEMFPTDPKPPQIRPMIDALAIVSESVDIATANPEFNAADFVIETAMYMADKLGRLEAAKRLGHSSGAMPVGSYDAFSQINSSLIAAVKDGFNKQQSTDDAWDKMLQKQRQFQLSKLQNEIKEREKYLTTK